MVKVSTRGDSIFRVLVLLFLVLAIYSRTFQYPFISLDDPD